MWATDASSCNGVRLGRIPDEANTLHVRLELPCQPKRVLDGRQAAEPCHVGRMVEMILAADAHSCAVGVGGEAEHVFPRWRRKPVCVGDGLERCRRRGNNQIEVAARHLAGDSVCGRHIAVRVVLPYLQAFAVHDAGAKSGSRPLRVALGRLQTIARLRLGIKDLRCAHSNGYRGLIWRRRSRSDAHRPL